MSTRTSAEAAVHDPAEPAFPPDPVMISFGYDTGFSANPQTLVLNWPKPPQSSITITFQLDTETEQNFSFYDRGIVFQYPHDSFTLQPDPPPGTVQFTANPASTSEVTAFRYAILLQDKSSQRVCFFDPTVQNDPPPLPQT
jgi:hypothetical protein